MLSSLLVVLASSWFWIAWHHNKFLATGLLLATISLELSLTKKNKFYYILSLIFLGSLLLAQLQTTNWELNNLNSRSLDEIAIRQNRLSLYPEVAVILNGAEYQLPIVQLFELRQETLILHNLKNNLGQFLDLNFYFFANHPREEAGVPRINIFHFLYLPFFLLGAFIFIRKDNPLKSKLLLLISLLAPLILTTIVGFNNPMGPFSIYPFMSVCIVSGIIYVLNLVFTRPHEAT